MRTPGGEAQVLVEGLTCRRAGREVLRDVSFRLAPGEVVAVIGPNGAGKTTLLEAVVGIQPVERGQVTVAGRPIRSLADRSRLFSYMPDDAEPPAEVRVGAVLAHAIHYGRPAPGLVEELTDRLSLAALSEARSGDLSRGERRRLSLFCALGTSRPVAILDEPLGAFDPLQLLGITDLLRERARDGVALLLSIHQMSDAEKIADRVLLLDAGQAVALGTLDELRARVGSPAASLEQVFLALLRGERRERAAP
jgi:ABC-2 type transport system ATP-binding protein